MASNKFGCGTKTGPDGKFSVCFPASELPKQDMYVLQYERSNGSMIGMCPTFQLQDASIESADRKVQ